MKSITFVLLVCLIFFVNSQIVLPESFSAELFIKSRQSSTISTYKAFLQKTKGSVEVVSANIDSNEQFIYLDGQMIRKSQKGVECVPQEDVPPFKDFSKIFKNQKRIESKTFDIEVNKCKEEKYSFNYAGEYFVLCLEKKLPKKIIGRNLIILIQNFSSTKVAKFFTTTEVKKCSKNQEKINYPKEKEPWFSQKEICLLSTISDSKECEKQKILTTPTKDCIFFHGSGETVTGKIIQKKLKIFQRTTTHRTS